MTLRFPLLHLAASLALALPAVAEDLPAAPTPGLRDDTRALSETRQTELARDIAAFRADLGVDLWFTAGTFLPSGETVRSHARRLRQHWSPQREAVLLAYDRASDSLGVSLSPGLWQRYPTAELNALPQRLAPLMMQKGQPLEDRLSQSLRLIATRLQQLEKQHRISQGPLSPAHLQLGRAYAIGLAAGASLLALLGILSRRRAIHAAWQLHFPSVQVGLRFGAPHGGGVLAEKAP
ncbi:hypothetical protein [Prosthecobacter dejongeii]|uniref:TPM domain-containing protein n=1 Tax=Prosthecobacter dejongeii TaxID=48465 RepID=A0A7W8DQY7_9BACT|nr:hypothetical protein [Prosthecobacter dejongeii]MBB5038705.1 hypothetical protein [Prosthecobacter dejongeii]